MDIHCPKCGEPWDMNELHDETEARIDDGRLPKDAPYEKNYNVVRQEFWSRGCPALYGSTCNEERDGDTALASAMLHDLLGDDTDGIAAMMEDFGMGEW